MYSEVEVYTGELSTDAIVSYAESLIPSKVQTVNTIEEWSHIRENFPALVKVLLLVESSDTTLDIPYQYNSYKYHKGMVFAVMRVNKNENNAFVNVYNVTKFPSIVIVKVINGFVW
jgi:hypothetical protein